MVAAERDDFDELLPWTVRVGEAVVGVPTAVVERLAAGEDENEHDC